MNRVEPTAFSAPPPQLIVDGKFVVCTIRVAEPAASG